jgi:hypothetical protein
MLQSGRSVSLLSYEVKTCDDLTGSDLQIRRLDGEGRGEACSAGEVRRSSYDPALLISSLNTGKGIRMSR